MEKKNLNQEKMTTSTKLAYKNIVSIIVVAIIILLIIQTLVYRENIEQSQNNTSNNIAQQYIENNNENLIEVDNETEQNNHVENNNTNVRQLDGTLEKAVLDKDKFQVFFIYVGQADCILIQNKNKVMIIDAGNNVDGVKIIEYLKSLGITKIDYLIGTHPHEDHIGGIDDIINNFYIGKVYMPQRSTDLRTYNDIISALRKKNMRYISPEIGEKIQLGDATCEVMMVDKNAEKLNNCSIVIEITYGENKFLFTGDMEKLKEESRSWNDIDVLKVGHHGSNSSTGKTFLEQIKPEYAVIQCGIDNSYGYPHEEILESLKKIGANIYRTDKDGSIYMESDGKKISVYSLKVDCDVKEDN